MVTRNEPAIYCGTYAKYNSGSIDGAWIILENHTKESFYKSCKSLHRDESDPELMFQDYENFPEVFYSESGLHDKFWEWLELDESDRDIFAAFLSYDKDADFSDARDLFMGAYDSFQDFADEFLDEGELATMPEWIQRYFDREAYARDLEHDFNVIDYEGKKYIFSY